MAERVELTEAEREALRFTRRSGPREITVELEIDASRFVDGMLRAYEATSVIKYRQRIEHERSLGKAQVGVLLDQMCRDLGMDPVKAWRLPRVLEQAERARGKSA